TAGSGRTRRAAPAPAGLGRRWVGLASGGGGKPAVIVAAMPQALRLKMITGPNFDYDIIASTSLAAGTVAVVEVASLVSGFGSTAKFTASPYSAIHLEDTSPQDITGGTPSPAVPVKSMFQIDAIALKTTPWGAGGRRAPGHAQWITGCMW